MDRIKLEIPFSKGLDGKLFTKPTEESFNRSILFGRLSFHIGIIDDIDIDDPDALLPYSQDAMDRKNVLTTEINPDDLEIRLISIKDDCADFWVADCEVSTLPFKGLAVEMISAWIPHYHPRTEVHGNKVIFMINKPSVKLN